MNRTTYLLGDSILGLILTPLALASKETVARAQHSAIAGIALPLFMIIFFYYMFNFAARRFNDLGKPSWWAILRIVPGCEIVLLFLSGVSGPNRFGDQPTKKFDFNDLF